jgi:hypothetical protein
MQSAVLWRYGHYKTILYFSPYLSPQVSLQTRILTPENPMSIPFCDLKTPWFRLIGEHLETDRGDILDYWRVERSDSVIILPLYRETWLLPPAIHRPGAGVATWDFPGGRALADRSLVDSALAILERELQIPPDRVQDCWPLNTEGWWVNSSFSNQRLYGFVAEIDENTELNPAAIGAMYAIRDSQMLLEKFTCLQCRSLLQQWMIGKLRIENL